MNNKKKGGRPRLDANEKKTERIVVRMNSLELTRLKEKASAAGMTIPEYLRSCIKKSSIMPRLSNEEMHRIRQLCGMANNLNQLAHQAHIHNYAQDVRDYRLLAYHIYCIIKSIRDVREGDG